MMFVFAVLLSSVFANLAPVRAEQNINFRSIAYGADPVKFQEITEIEDMSADPVPWNVDMVDAETTGNEGEDIYVAILDTGLLSNYLDFFPESMVDIKEEWGIGFSHDVWYDPLGDGNWSTEVAGGVEYKFSYGPVRNDRGFITHDNGAPDKYGYGWGSGHGTHVTSIVTGYHFWRTTVDTWIAGVAPKVTLIPVLVLDDWIEFAPGGGWMWTGGTWEMIAEGIKYIGDLAEEHGIKIIINMSLGGGSPSTMIEQAINYAINRGVIVVASAGNDGYAGMGWPGAYPQVISVAAAGWTQEYGGGNYQDGYYWWWNDVPEKLNTNNYVEDLDGTTYKNNWHAYLTDFSSRANSTLGQSWTDLDVAAPGAAIRGPYKPYGSTQFGFYGVWGTSQAAPHVSGIAALVLESYPNLAQAEMETILKHAAKRIPLAADGAYVSDVFSDFAIWYYWWNDHDAGSGFLTVDEAMSSAHRLTRRAGGSSGCTLR